MVCVVILVSHFEKRNRIENIKVHCFDVKLHDVKYYGHSKRATALNSRGECVLGHEEEIEFESKERGQSLEAGRCHHKLYSNSE